MNQVYVYAIAQREKVGNPADRVRLASIATFAPKDRALSPGNPAIRAADGVGRVVVYGPVDLCGAKPVANKRLLVPHIRTDIIAV